MVTLLSLPLKSQAPAAVKQSYCAIKTGSPYGAKAWVKVEAAEKAGGSVEAAAKIKAAGKINKANQC